MLQLPSALARYLSSKGEDAIHVKDVDMLEASDNEIWSLALSDNLVIISKEKTSKYWRPSVIGHPTLSGCA